MKRSIVWTLLGAVVLGLGAWYLMSDDDADVDRARPPAATARSQSEPNVVRLSPGQGTDATIQTEQVRYAPVPFTDPLNARLAYDESVTARISSPIAGRVLRIVHDVGDPVNAGDPLVEIDSPDLGAAQADVEKARVESARTQADLTRTRELVKAGVTPQKELLAAQSAASEAAFELDRATLRMRNLNAATGNGKRGAPPIARGSQQLVLRAPLSGTIAERNVTPSLEVRPDLDKPLFVVSDLRRLWAIIDLPESVLSQARPGAEISVEVDAWPGLKFVGQIERVGAAVDPNTRRVQVRCKLDNSEGRLKPEMYARVAIVGAGMGMGVRLPNTALIGGGSRAYVFVEKEPNVFRRVEVQAIRRGARFSYVTGIEQNDIVVTQGALLLNSELNSVN